MNAKRVILRGCIIDAARAAASIDDTISEGGCFGGALLSLALKIVLNENTPSIFSYFPGLGVSFMLLTEWIDLNPNQLVLGI
jgi:hypothetical protein